MNDKEFEEKVKAWRGQPVDRILISDLAIFIDQLIAYVEELREREIGWTMALSSLEEENEKLKEELETERKEWHP